MHSKPLKILFVIGQLAKGGAETQLGHWLQGLRQEGHEPHVFVWNFNPKDFFVDVIRGRGIEVHGLRAERAPSVARKLQALMTEMRRIGPHIVQSHSFYLNPWVALMGAKFGVPAIGALRSDFTREVLETPWPLGFLASHFPRFKICNSQAALRNAKSALSPKHVVIRIANAIHAPTKPARMPPFKSLQIVAIGRLHQVKRWERLINVAAALRARGVDFQIKLAGEGPKRAALQQQIISQQLTNHVTLLGEVHETARLLQSAHCLLHTSDAEGFSNVILEALSQGRAVIATAAGDNDQLISNGENGFLTALDQSEAAITQSLTDAAALLSCDAALLKKMGRQAFQSSAAQFSVKAGTMRLLETYALCLPTPITMSAP